MAQTKKRRYRPGLTKKRLNNKKFFRTEDAILKVILREKDYMGLGTMAKKVGVARSTVYYHHRAIKEIVPDYKVYILMEYKRMMRKALKNNDIRIKQVYLKMLTFIMINRRLFMVFDKMGDKSEMSKMVDELRTKIEEVTGLPHSSEKVFVVLRGELLAILEKWGESEYDEMMIEEVLGDLSYLTNTARNRLKGVV